MSITVELTYDMSKALGEQRLELGGARTVRDALRMVEERFGESQESFGKLSRVASVAVNGVLINHRKGMRTRLSDGDTVAFLKPAAGG
jgi:molybdopterin converting factor small subunit